MNYQRLGDYIREVDVRNRELKVTKPRGINIDKHFMPSVANVIGTDLSTYKLVSKKQFACNLMHVGRDEKIPMAMQTDDNLIIVSPAYFVFEISQTEALLPEYLMMWFSRPEFDRNAWFYTDADVRGGMDKSSFRDRTLSIPSITRQREIVSEYETLTNRINLNEQMIQHLEATAQSIYRKMFVDGIDKENLPKGWNKGTLGDFGIVITGKTPSTLDAHNFGDYMPFVTIPDMHDGFYVVNTERMLSRKGVKSQAKKTIPKDAICVSCIGTSGLVVITPQECQTNQQINTIIPNNPNALYYIYMICCDMEQVISEYGIGGAVLNNLNKNDFEKLPAIIPSEGTLKESSNKIKPLFDLIHLYQIETSKLKELQSLQLAKMGNLKQ